MTPRRILITGATGFIGARIAERLHEHGHQLALLVRDPRTTDRAAAIYGQCDLIVGDLGSPALYIDALRGFRPDTLLHAAWSGVAGADRNDPRQIVNIAATADLLEAAIGAGIESFIGLGSQAEYGPQNSKLNEEAAVEPTTLYGHSKRAACRVTEAICRLRQLRHTWLRVFSIYGPRDNPNWLIPSLIAKLNRGEIPELTKCEQIWDFLYIDDAVDAVVAVLENPAAAGIYNLGSGQARPLRETVMLLRDIVRPGAELGIGCLPYRPDQVMHLEADMTRLSDATGWQPKTDLQTGLQATVEWLCEPPEK
ncbi:NAD(P)-dependent oxidoreductase [Methylovirgula sp. HY1]|uniref:NAD-dependent epimerase/dehydratase family protein n=1 Tax=Methylovirgula sp. HY1 TaxID=2822761 RepID=UPI001C5BAD55|nr:NAD(P)-dependent oxidoreductase [Methylovirgula sp. HY1]QXX76667.1 CDP-abequose synthase [Methylovirgula sp. HY1]